MPGNDSLGITLLNSTDHFVRGAFPLTGKTSFVSLRLSERDRAMSSQSFGETNRLTFSPHGAFDP